MTSSIVVWCRACQGPHHDCAFPRPRLTLRAGLLMLLWNVIDWPAILAARAGTMLMLATLPIHHETRHELWNAGYPIYRWDWANRWERRLDAIAFDGLSYWLNQRMGKPSGGNGTVPLSRVSAFVRTYLDPTR